MKVYVIRHGESETNEKGLWTGCADVRLTERGKKQAQKAGELLKNITFDKIYTSDLIRAKETAENAISGCDYEISELIREFNVGNLTKMPYSDVTDEQRAIISKAGFAVFGGESSAEMESRVSKFMKALEKENYKNVAVFTHNGWLRAFINIVLNTTVPRANLCCKNCTIVTFEYSEGIWKLYGLTNLD